MNTQTFFRFVKQAMEDLPQDFREKLENVEIIVEDYPDRETLADLGIRSRLDLMGLYVGTPITERSVFQSPSLPDRIFLYRVPILRAAGGRQRIAETIRDVFIHEVGHHFGFNDDQLEQMEKSSE
ncbi:MAG: metallopeptidase family protein [Desulfomonile sp.]|nr:metallopeptidase family protein [Desulfomonile sp.]